PRAAGLRRPARGRLRPARLATVVWGPAAGGDRAGAGVRAEGAAARRADRRHEPAGIPAADRVHAPAAGGAEADDPAHRARHEGGDGCLRARHGARLRREDRRGQAGRRPHEPAGHRGLSWEAGLMPLLEVSDLHTHYGSIEALKGVSLAVDAGQVVTLIGSNGAGKTTTLRSISGLTPASAGKITFAG